VSASECRAVQVDLVLIGPQHGSGSAPKQQTLNSLAKSLSLEVECVVNLARTKTPSNLVNDQPTMAVVYFCYDYEPAPKQLTPGRKDLVICFAKPKLQVGTGAFDARFGLTNMKTADLPQHIMRGVKLGHSAVHANAASRLPAGSRKQRSYACRDVHDVALVSRLDLAHREIPPQRQTCSLRAWRSDVARKRGVPAYVVLHDTTIDGIASARPTTLGQLRDIPGIDDKKLEHYGATCWRWSRRQGRRGRVSSPAPAQMSSTDIAGPDWLARFY